MLRLSAKEKKYILETTGLFVSGLGMLVLLVISVWVVGISVIGSRTAANQIIGTAPRLSVDKDDFARINQLVGNNGQVAGVVDESSPSEEDIRNAVADWVSLVRSAEQLNPAYRDTILDRSAQNHARAIADSCDLSQYTNWQESLGKNVSEGVIYGYSESAFVVGGVTFASEFPANEIDYARIFQDYNAFGVGVASTQSATTCSGNYIVVLHLASVR